MNSAQRICRNFLLKNLIFAHFEKNIMITANHLRVNC
ncbi:hypothetical protein FIC_01268 [Flavobacteriaceae bacterium 3519-10]|nr:hypothetical protein FIC_01268 [Flavobacteriaceae bacterium 3519-10]